MKGADMLGDLMELGGDSLPKPMDRNLYLFEDVDCGVIERLTNTINRICEHDQYLIKLYSIHGLIYNPKPIRLHIDSPGGHLYAGLGFASLIQTTKTPVDTIVYGHAMSAALLISVCGSTRYCQKTSSFMYHQLSLGMGDDNKLKDLIDDVAETKRLQSVYDKVICSTTKITKSQIAQAFNTKTDLYLSVADALKYSVVDKII